VAAAAIDKIQRPKPLKLQITEREFSPVQSLNITLNVGATKKCLVFKADQHDRLPAIYFYLHGTATQFSNAEKYMTKATHFSTAEKYMTKHTSTKPKKLHYTSPLPYICS
jgi:hypothetical protein